MRTAAPAHGSRALPTGWLSTPTRAAPARSSQRRAARRGWSTSTVSGIAGRCGRTAGSHGQMADRIRRSTRTGATALAATSETSTGPSSATFSRALLHNSPPSGSATVSPYDRIRPVCLEFRLARRLVCYAWLAGSFFPSPAPGGDKKKPPAPGVGTGGSHSLRNALFQVCVPTTTTRLRRVWRRAWRRRRAPP